MNGCNAFIKSFKMTEVESLYLERIYYELKSHEGLLKLICAELNGNEQLNAKELISQYESTYKEIFTKFEMAKEYVLRSYLGDDIVTRPVQYILDFPNEEVKYWYE